MAPAPARTLTPERQALALRYLPMARALAAPFARAWPRLADEFRAVAAAELVEAALAYDPARGVSFARFARAGIAGGLIGVQVAQLPRGRRSPNVRSGARLVSLRPGDERHGRVFGAAPDEPVGEALARDDRIDRWLAKLPPAEAQLVRDHYLGGVPRSELEGGDGTRNERVEVRLRKAVRRLNVIARPDSEPEEFRKRGKFSSGAGESSDRP